MLNKTIVILLFILTLMIIVYLSPKLIDCIENHF
jgi:hypothetical protein